MADLHFNELAPAARSCEGSWYEVQKRHMRQLQLLTSTRPAPLLVAGDVFDKWNPSCRCVSWALEWLAGFPGGVWAIPGNHDLPDKSYAQLDRSGYWTLVESGRLKHLTPGIGLEIGNMYVTAFPPSFKVEPPATKESYPLKVAIVHDYVWAPNFGYQGAPESALLGGWRKRLEGYDVAVFGDNHHGFLAPSKGRCSVANCGTLIRRKTDEKHLKPAVTVLYQNGELARLPLDVSKDQFVDVDEQVAGLSQSLRLSLSGFVSDLEGLHAERVEWAKVVAHWCANNNVPGEVVRIMLAAAGVGHAQRA